MGISATNLVVLDRPDDEDTTREPVHFPVHLIRCGRTPEVRGSFRGSSCLRDSSLRYYPTSPVYVEGHALSHGDLIAEVAQQIGSAHEDPSIDPHLAALERIEIGGIASHGRSLMETGQLVYGAALGLIGHAVEQLSFIPQYHEVRRSEPVQGEDATTATTSDKRPRPS